MAEFCNCGSIIINGSCTNKACPNHARQTASKSVKKKKTLPGESNITMETESSSKSEKKKDPRRASKCITYNIYDLGKTKN